MGSHATSASTHAQNQVRVKRQWPHSEGMMMSLQCSVTDSARKHMTWFLPKRPQKTMAPIRNQAFVVTVIPAVHLG